MTAIPPAPPPLPAALPAGGGATVAVVMGGTPSAIQALPQGTMLEALIQARGARGFVEVLTDKGPVTLRLPADMAQLPAGSRLMLQVLQPGAEAQFRIVGLNGRPLPATPGQPGLMNAGQPGMITNTGPLPAGQPAAMNGPAGMARMPAGAPAPQIAGQGSAANAGGVAPPPQGAPAPAGITATLLRPAAPGTPAPPAAQTGGLPTNLPPGTQITLRIASAAPPAPSAGAPPQAVQVAPTPRPAAPPPPQAPNAPAPPPGAAPPATAPTLLAGTVTVQPPGGRAVVQTPIGTLSLPTPPDLPVGSKLTLEVIGKPEPPPPLPPSGAKTQGLTAAGWPALTEAADTLARTDARTAEQFLRAIPQANPRLAAAMAVFAAALRSNDPRRILSDGVTKGLERAGKRDVGDRLKGDMDKLSAESSRPLAGGEWRALTMPFLDGSQIEPIRLYLKAVGDDDESHRQGGKDDGKRFVLEVSMTRLGRVQLDGLVQREDKQFDLIVRTEEPLPDAMRADITAIFVENAGICGVTGQVAFQSGRFVDLPPPDAIAPSTALTV